MSTGECVTQVKARFEHDNIWHAFAEVTNSIDQAIQNHDEAELNRLVKENHRLLAHIGVVPEKVQQFVNAVELTGAAAKICGAGAVSGEKAGVVMVVGGEDDNIIPICKRYGYELNAIKGEARGLHVA
jgi:hypothetical protein